MSPLELFRKFKVQKKPHFRAKKDFYPSVNLECAFLNPTRTLLQRKSSEAEFDKWHIVFL